MNFKLYLITLSLTLTSCSNTKWVYKDINYPAKISLKKNSFRTIEIAEVTAQSNPISFEQNILNESYGRNFKAESFKSILENTLAKSKKLKVIHRPSNKEIIHDKLANKKIINKKTNLTVHGSYQEYSGEEGYSNDNTGKNSRMIYAESKFNYKIVDNKTGQIIHSDIISRRTREFKSKSEVFLGKLTTETLAIKNRKSIANRVLSIFSPITISRGFEFKKGKNDKFTEVISLIEKGNLKKALFLQNKLLVNSNKDDLSDGHFNKSLLLLLQGRKKDALDASKEVKNGFFFKDFDNIRSKINNF